MNRNLKKCIEVVKRGGIAVFPTDTAFGVGCRIDDIAAVKRLFTIRKRPENKAILILVSSKRMARRYIADFPPEAKKITEKKWPEGLTIVFRANKEMVPYEVRGGGDTIGIRLPAHSTILKLIREVGVPILAPSANFAGEPTPFSLREVSRDFLKSVDFVMPGKCKIKEQSTIIDLSSEKMKIIRKGAAKI